MRESLKQSKMEVGFEGNVTMISLKESKIQNTKYKIVG
jgi:hypothetical protein